VPGHTLRVLAHRLYMNVTGFARRTGDGRYRWGRYHQGPGIGMGDRGRDARWGLNPRCPRARARPGESQGFSRDATKVR
jgi:hypothetical protein